MSVGRQQQDDPAANNGPMGQQAGQGTAIVISRDQGATMLHMRSPSVVWILRSSPSSWAISPAAAASGRQGARISAAQSGGRAAPSECCQPQ